MRLVKKEIVPFKLGMKEKIMVKNADSFGIYTIMIKKTFVIFCRILLLEINHLFQSAKLLNIKKHIYMKLGWGVTILNINHHNLHLD
jgi:hypothetical protein